MSAIPSIPLAPHQLGAWLAAQAPSPPTAADSPATPDSVLAALRQQSVLPVQAVTDPLLSSGGLQAQEAWQDHQIAVRQRLKIILAGSKLHAGLVIAAYGHDRQDPPTTDAVDAYVTRASQWIEGTTRELTRQWLKPAGDDPGAGDTALSAYHRYEIARLLADALRERPALLDQVEPARMAVYLTAQSDLVLPVESPVEWRSAGAAADLHMAWSRALARVLETAVRHDFNRETDTLLQDARAAIAETAHRQTDRLATALELNPDARRIALLHAIKLGGQLYAATLAHVHRDSVRVIEAYQERLNAGDTAGADRLASEYQERRLGYTGIPHHFQQAIAQLDRLVTAALSAAPEPAATDARWGAPHPPTAERPLEPRHPSP